VRFSAVSEFRGSAVPRPRHHRIRADEPPHRRIVVARLVVVQAEGLLPALAGEAVFGWECAAAPAHPAVGVVALPGYLVAVFVGGEAGGAEVVGGFEPLKR